MIASLVWRLVVASVIVPVGLAQDGATAIDAGGERSVVDNIVSEASVGGIVGVSVTDAPGAVFKAGFFGQIYEVTNLVITATPSVLLPGQTSQLSGTAQLDDGTFLAVSGSEIVWDPAVPPIDSITAAGVATAAGVTAQQQGTITGSYRGVSGAAVIVVYPGVTTLAATDVVADGPNVSATLNGSVSPGGLPTMAWFEWGADTSYGQVTPALAIEQGATSVPFAAPLTGLTPGVTYHFRAMASNSLGLSAGADQAFGLNTIPVTTLADAGPGSLRQAVADAGAGFTITFGVTGTIVLTSGELVIRKELNFSGPGAESLTLSGHRAHRIFNVLAVKAELTGLTLADGSAPSGGAIFSQGDLRIAGCVFQGNEATSDRGGAIAAAGPLWVRDTTFSANRAAGGGGAIDTRSLEVDIADCTFVSNQAGNGGAIAAGITVPADPITIAGLGRTSTYSNVELNDTGATVAMVAPEADVRFRAQYTTAYVEGGGGCPNCLTQHYLGLNGVFADCHDLRTRAGTSGSIDQQFTAPSSPGVYYITQTPTWWYYCDQFGTPGFANTPEGAVAVLVVGQPSSRIANSTFSDNQGGLRGGAVALDEPAQFELINCTLTRNGAILGGAVFGTESPATLQLLNSIVAGNGADLGPDIAGWVDSGGHNLIGNTNEIIGGLVATDLTGVDPQLGPLQDNGGPTWTHALRIGSPAIDAGNDDVALGEDQRGLPRLSGAAVPALVDIGAYELQFPSISSVTNQAVLEDGTVGPIGFTVADAEWPATSLSVVASSSNPSVLSAEGMALDGAGGSRSITLRPVANASGSSTVGLRVTNPLGAASSTQFNLTVLPVNDAPSFALSTNRIEVLIDSGPQVVSGAAANLSAGPADESAQALEFSVLANSNPAMFASGGAPAIAPNGTLTFTSGVGAFGSATTTVVLRDNGGVANGGQDASGATNLVIDVVTVPIITSQPLSQTNQAGATVYFTVVAEANPPPDYQWKFEGLAILDATNAVLALPNVQASKAGTYEVEVRNRIGRVQSAPAVLAVTMPKDPPDIAQAPTDQQVRVGQTLILSASVVGTPPFTFQWLRNGASLPGQTEGGPSDPLLAHGGLTITNTATSSTLIVTNFQPADAGTYSIEVQNGLGIVESSGASVTLVADSLAYSDAFAGPHQPLALNGIGVADTTGFTVELGEPAHDSSECGSSAWFTWNAPSDGLATFATAGSAIDTVLAVYEGDQVDTLTRVESDDDRGGWFTSFLRFNARAGHTYQVAVADWNETGGSVVLGWRFDDGRRGPVIVSQPDDLLLTDTNHPIVFEVVIENTAGIQFQWRRDGRDLTDNPHHVNTRTPRLTVLPTLGPEDVGLYTVYVKDGDPLNPALESEPAILEIAYGNVNTNVPSQDKFKDLLALVRTNLPPVRRPGMLHQGGSQSVSAGTIISDNFGARTQAAERPVANVIGGSSRWYYLPLTRNGLFTVQTTGSSFDSLLAIYSTTNLADATLANLNFVAGDDNSAPDGKNALVRFMGETNRVYFAVVDGRFGVQGAVQLAWSFTDNPPPDQFRWFVCQTNIAGVLTVDTVASGIGRVYLVYTGTDYSNLTDAPFTEEKEEDRLIQVHFPVVADRLYVVLADAANGNPSSIRPVWRVHALDSLVIQRTRRAVQLQWANPRSRLQSAPTVDGPWFDLGLPTYTEDGHIVAPLPPAAPLQIFRLVPPR